MNTIHELRKNKYKVRVIKKRFYSSFDSVHRKVYKRLLSKRDAKVILDGDDFRYGLSHKGGFTRIEITSPDGKEYAAETYCSRKDTFNKKFGVSLCLDRILKQLNQG